jgi:hypothetical protein
MVENGIWVTKHIQSMLKIIPRILSFRKMLEGRGTHRQDQDQHQHSKLH